MHDHNVVSNLGHSCTSIDTCVFMYNDRHDVIVVCFYECIVSNIHERFIVFIDLHVYMAGVGNIELLLHAINASTCKYFMFIT